MRKMTPLQWKKRYNSPDFLDNYIYEEHDLGVSCSDSGTSFLLWSPFAQRVCLRLYETGESKQAFKSIFMKQEEKGVWAYRDAKNLHGIYYDYELELEGESRVSADPYAKACGVNGVRSMAVDLRSTDPKGWAEDEAPARQQETVIYELHVKEFSWDEAGGFPESSRGKYKAFLCDDTTLFGDHIHKTGISYLKDLGVTHVQLMPIYDFGSVDEAGDPAEFNWGYDPLNYNVPEGSYATDPCRGEVRIRELKEMIHSLHKNGFRVIMDVVYNHTHNLDSWFQRCVPWYYYRVDEKGAPSNGSHCGNDLASERPMCGSYILDSVLYWAREYHMDGFRFDLMGLLDTDLMNRIRRALDQEYGRGEKLVFGEPWAADKTAMEQGAVQALKKNIHLLDQQVGMFSDDTRDAIKGSVFEFLEPGFVNGGTGLEEQILNCVKGWCKTPEAGFSVKAPSQAITYVSSHDNHTLWDKLDLTVADEALKKKSCRLAAAIYMTCQGTPFFLSGEEFARTKEKRDNTYNAPIGLNRLDWEQAWREQELVEYYKGLIALRKQLPGLCDKTREAPDRIFGQWKENGLLGFSVRNRKKGESSPWKELMVVYNSRKEAVPLKPLEGKWQILADGTSSFLWKESSFVSHKLTIAPVSPLLLGRE